MAAKVFASNLTRRRESHASFFYSRRKPAIAQFLQDGYWIFSLSDLSLLDRLQETLYRKGLELLNFSPDLSRAEFFDFTHKLVSTDELNDFRVQLIAHMARDESIRPLVYHLAKPQLHWLVGNELAMQRNCNLSIQFPEDDSSLLPLHSDVWSGNSPYEVVLWLPLVDCYQTKSMFLLPRPESEAILSNFRQYASLSTEELYREIESNLVWFEVRCGQAAIFSHAMLHGNRINRETTTRWTINVRFKSLLSPYGSKGLGESFLPITMRPTTHIGAGYRKPECL
ncbi:hypothetical protein HC928_08790 [bacterium]|nr:hypothetical protein [bacterium]